MKFLEICLLERRILARLHGVQKVLANNPNDFLLELE